jgi:hypothetical protein
MELVDHSEETGPGRTGDQMREMSYTQHRLNIGRTGNCKAHISQSGK